MTTRSVEEEYGNNSCNKDEVGIEYSSTVRPRTGVIKDRVSVRSKALRMKNVTPW